jgi:NAD/NADP transhydrogenase alpha subunit
MKTDLLTSLYVFLLAAFIGFEVIRRIARLLHTPLMSLINALDAIAVGGTPINLASSAPDHASQLYARHWQLSI